MRLRLSCEATYRYGLVVFVGALIFLTVPISIRAEDDQGLTSEEAEQAITQSRVTSKQRLEQEINVLRQQLEAQKELTQSTELNAQVAVLQQQRTDLLAAFVSDRENIKKPQSVDVPALQRQRGEQRAQLAARREELTQQSELTPDLQQERLNYVADYSARVSQRLTAAVTRLDVLVDKLQNHINTINDDDTKVRLNRDLAGLVGQQVSAHLLVLSAQLALDAITTEVDQPAAVATATDQTNNAVAALSELKTALLVIANQL